jgi:hypothetical protein
MDPIELKQRTRQFAVRVLKFADALPGKSSGKTIAHHIARSGTSVTARNRQS